LQAGNSYYQLAAPSLEGHGVKQQVRPQQLRCDKAAAIARGQKKSKSLLLLPLLIAEQLALLVTVVPLSLCNRIRAPSERENMSDEEGDYEEVRTARYSASGARICDDSTVRFLLFC
jgi:hypothetical protein